MPQILSKKNGGIYKPKDDDEVHICATFKCASADKNVIDGKPEDTTLTKISNQQTPAFGDGEPPKDTRIGPPSTSNGYVKHSISEETKPSGGTESTYKQSALVAAKLSNHKSGLPSSSTSGTPNSSSSSSGGLHPSFFKHGSLIPNTGSGYNWKKRRFAIDLGRRARVFGKYLCSIDEDAELDFDIYDSFKTFHILL